jgi:hypothetical protein
MKLSTLLVFAIGITCPLVAEPKKETTRPDYYTYQADGSVKTRCIYETNSEGRVTKLTVFDGAGSLKYAEIPYYSADGHLIRGDRFDPNGKLKLVVVYFDTFLKVLDAEGNIVDTQGYKPEK